MGVRGKGERIIMKEIIPTSSTISAYTETDIVTSAGIFDISEIVELSIPVAIAVLGWIFTAWRQQVAMKKQHKFDIVYDIYKQFTILHGNTQEVLSKLSTSYAPFILMESSTILKPEQEGLSAGLRLWTEFVEDRNNTYFELNDAYLSILGMFDNWEAVFKPLLDCKEILTQEVNRLKNDIHSDLTTLQLFSTTNGIDWKKWDKSEVELITKNINDNATTISLYLHDFMVMLHNESIADYFKQKRPTRKTLDSAFKVLTKKGLVVNLNHEHLSRMKEYQEKHDLAANSCWRRMPQINGTKDAVFDELKSRKSGICPVCGNKIQVISQMTLNEEEVFTYMCGHGWKTSSSED